MTPQNDALDVLLDSIVDLLDIPRSYYEKAEDRYHSLGEWLHRPESTVVHLDPQVYPQGSFRYGTVNRPVHDTEEYDLDLVMEVHRGKADGTQEQLKHLLGNEVKAYAERHGFKHPPTERNRCWRLDYADEVSFHMDALPCIPEDPDVVRVLGVLGVPPHLAETSVAITDRRHPRYRQLTRDWPCSNPRGLGRWFEERMRYVARPRMMKLVEAKVYASIDRVPPYEWKTPLQRSIQILKRHRDVMYLDRPTWAPISMIITVLAAQAYQGETKLAAALTGILDRMPEYVRDKKPRIPNPVNPAEDFADRWATDQRYEQAFWAWHTAASADIAKLPSLLRKDSLATDIRGLFRVDLTVEQLRRLRGHAGVAVPAVAVTRPTLSIAAAPRPWRDYD